MSHRMLAQANWTKASQLVDFLHQRVRTLRRLTSQPKVRLTTQRCWILRLAGDGMVIGQRLTAPALALDVRHIAGLGDGLAHIVEIIAFIAAEVLLRSRPLDGHMTTTKSRTDHLSCWLAPLMSMASGAPRLIDQEMDLGAQLGTVVGFLPVSLPPRGAAHERLSTACQRHWMPLHRR